jgi:hypothetical protein
MAEYVPARFPGNDITLTASATIVGGQLVEVTGNMTVGPAAVNSAKCVGVAGRDAANTVTLPVFTKGVHYLTAAGAISAGDKVICAAAGTVATAGAATFEKVIGIALEAIADTASGRVMLNLT